MNFRNLKTLLAAFAFVAVFIACEKDDSDPVPTLPYEDVFGEWDWYSTVLKETDEIILADSVDYSQNLDITSSGKYIWTRADSTLFDTEYTVAEDTTSAGEEVFIFQFVDTTMADQSFYLKTKDTLYLDDECENCESHIFVRKN